MLQQREPQRDDRGRQVTEVAVTAPHHEALPCDAQASCTLERSLQAPAQARTFVAQRLCERHGLLADAAAGLVTSELVTDAVLGGGGPVAVAIECHVTFLRLSVTRSTDRPAGSSELRLADPVADMIVAGICRASGTLVADGALTMWCTFPTGFLPRQPSGPRASE